MAIIKTLQVEHAAALAALWHAGTLESGAIEPRYLPKISVEDYTEAMAAELKTGLLGWGVFAPEAEGGGLRAYLTAQVQPAAAHYQQTAVLQVLDVDVAAGARGQGLSRLLLDVARIHAQKLGLARLEIHWLNDDPRASAVWTRLGFRPYLQRGYLELDQSPWWNAEPD